MLHVLLALVLSPPPISPSLAATSLVMSKAGDAVVTLTINDSALPPVTALDVAVDGEVKTTVLVFGKIGHPPYTALLPALPAGRHDITAQASPYWAWPSGAAAPTLTAFAAPDSIVVSHAPVLWLRADTIGTSTDLPLVLYAEDLRVDGQAFFATASSSQTKTGAPPPPRSSRAGAVRRTLRWRTKRSGRVDGW